MSGAHSIIFFNIFTLNNHVISCHLICNVLLLCCYTTNFIFLLSFSQSTCPYIEEEFRPSLFYSPLKVGDINWNFEKFLVGKDGKVYFRYNPKATGTDDLRFDIEFLLRK